MGAKVQVKTTLHTCRSTDDSGVLVVDVVVAQGTTTTLKLLAGEDETPLVGWLGGRIHILGSWHR